MRWPSVWLTAFSVAAAVVAGCGGGGNRAPQPPKLPHALGLRLAGEANAVAEAVSGCEAQARAQVLKNDVEQSLAQIPVRFRATLRTRVAALPSRFTCVQEEPPPPENRGKGHEKHKKEKKHGRGGED